LVGFEKWILLLNLHFAFPLLNITGQDLERTSFGRVYAISAEGTWIWELGFGNFRCCGELEIAFLSGGTRSNLWDVEADEGRTPFGGGPHAVLHS
jgi:hypothetical protein